MRAEPFETLEARLALRVDLARVELLALLLVSDDLIGRVCLGEAHGGLGVILVGIGMQFLRKLPVGAFDRACVRRSRHT